MPLEFFAARAEMSAGTASGREKEAVGWLTHGQPRSPFSVRMWCRRGAVCCEWGRRCAQPPRWRGCEKAVCRTECCFYRLPTSAVELLQDCRVRRVVDVGCSQAAAVKSDRSSRGPLVTVVVCGRARFRWPAVEWIRKRYTFCFPAGSCLVTRDDGTLKCVCQ